MEEHTIKLRQVVDIFQRRYLIILLVTVVCAAVTFAVSTYLIKPEYTATASMYVFSDTSMQNNITQSQLEASQELISTYIVVLKSDTVLNEVTNQLKLNLNAEAIRKNLTAGAIMQTEAFSISYTDRDPKTAQMVVNAIAEIAPKEIIRVVKAGSAEVIDYAKEPTKSSFPNIPLDTVIGALVGFVVSFGIFIIAVLFDTKIRDEADLLKAFDIPVLGAIPKLVEIEGVSDLGGQQV